MVKARKGILIQADESIMAIIRKINKDNQNAYIIEELDSETCMVHPEMLEQLERRVKEHIQKHMPEAEGSDID